MIVCLCKGVSTSTVQRAISEGADSVEKIGRSCGAGSDCGSCHRHLEMLIREEVESRSGARHLPVVPARVRRDRAA